MKKQSILNKALLTNRQLAVCLEKEHYHGAIVLHQLLNILTQKYHTQMIKELIYDATLA